MNRISQMVGFILHGVNEDIHTIREGIEGEIQSLILKELNTIYPTNITVEVTKTDDLEYEILVTDANPTDRVENYKIGLKWDIEPPLAPMYRIIKEWSEPK